MQQLDVTPTLATPFCYSGTVAPFYHNLSGVLTKDDLFVIGTRTGELIVWNAHTCTQDRVLLGHTGPVQVLLLLEDGRIGSGSNDNDVRIWDLAVTESPSVVLRGHRGWVSQLVVLSNDRIASADSCSDIKIWDTRAYTCLRTLQASFGWAQMLVALSGDRLASSCMDCSIQIWNAETGRKGVTLHHTEKVYTLLELEDGRLVTGGAGNTLSVWDPTTFACIQILGDGSPHMGKLCILPGNRLAARGDALTIWDLSTGVKVPLAFNPEEGICELVCFESGMLVGGGRDGVVYVWDATATPIKCIARLRGGHAAAVCSVELLQNETLLTASIDGRVSIWDGEWTRQRRATARCKILKEDLMAAAWNPERGGAEWLILQECMD